MMAVSALRHRFDFLSAATLNEAGAALIYVNDGGVDSDGTAMSCVDFFFSSRRRHTRCSRDWSSDVCSSDLVLDNLDPKVHPYGRPKERPAGVDFIAGDVTDRNTLLAALKDVDIVSHQAAYQD